MKDPNVAIWAREQQQWLAEQYEIIHRYPISDPVLKRLAILLEGEGRLMNTTLDMIEQYVSE